MACDGFVNEVKLTSEELKTRFGMIRKEIIIARAIYRQMPPLFVPRRKSYGRKTRTALLPRFCTDFYSATKTALTATV